MFLTYKTVGEAIKKSESAINWIDLDKGQLDNPEAFHSIVTPGVLIGNSEIDWQSTGAGYREGEGTLTVKLVLRLPSETHLTDPLLSSSLQSLELADSVEVAVLSVPGIIDLAKSSDYPAGDYYVAERVFFISLLNSPNYVKKNVQLQFTPHLYKPASA